MQMSCLTWAFRTAQPAPSMKAHELSRMEEARLEAEHLRRAGARQRQRQLDIVSAFDEDHSMVLASAECGSSG